MDQMACSVGNIVAIDFKDPEKPVIEQIDRRFEDFGYALCIIDTRTEHADLTGDYAAIPRDMCKAAEYFGKEVLRDVPEEEFKDCVLCAGAVLSGLQIKRETVLPVSIPTMSVDIILFGAEHITFGIPFSARPDLLGLENGKV